MKIKQQTSTRPTSKLQRSSQANTSFSALLINQESNASPPLETEAKVEIQTSEHQPNPEQKNQPLDKVLLELEGIMQGLEANTHDHQRAQRAIDSLRDALHDMPQAFPLSPQDREEANTLLTV
ncbi:hypothetical protein JYT78_01680, partial [bacterium AH-315-I20]|nr:hypothetical protein [bacterium AH-315-I20]